MGFCLQPEFPCVVGDSFGLVSAEESRLCAL